MNLRVQKYDGHKKDGGFNILKVMILTVILGALAVLAAGYIFLGDPHLRKDRQIAKYALFLISLAKSNAISNGSQYGVFIDSTNRTFRMFRDTSNPSTMSYEPSDSTVFGYGPAPVSIPPDIIFSSTFANNTVVFLSNGKASQSGDFKFGFPDSTRVYTVSVFASNGKSKLH